MIELGDKVKDNISGFTGIVTSYTKFITGCDRCFVCPDKLDKEGSVIDGHSFDVLELAIVKKKAVSFNEPKEPKVKVKGSPRPGNEKRTMGEKTNR